MWEPKHTAYRAKDYRTPRTTQEIWGEYIYICEPEELESRNSKNIWIAVFAVALVGGLFLLISEGVIR